MAYDRYIGVFNGLNGGQKWYTSFSHSNYLIGGSFSLGRFGGCLDASLEFAIQNTYGKFALGDRVEIGYDSSNLWYEGVVVERSAGSSLKISLQGYGIHRYQGVAPDAEYTEITAAAMLADLYTTLIDPNESGGSFVSVAAVDLGAVTFDGNDSLPSVLNRWAEALSSSWAISPDAPRSFYFRKASALGGTYTVKQGTDFSWPDLAESLDETYTRAAVKGGFDADGKQVLQLAEKTYLSAPYHYRTRPLKMREIKSAATADAIGAAFLDVECTAKRKERLPEVFVAETDVTAASVPQPWNDIIVAKRRDASVYFRKRLDKVQVDISKAGLRLAMDFGNGSAILSLGDALKDLIDRRELDGDSFFQPPYADADAASFLDGLYDDLSALPTWDSEQGLYDNLKDALAADDTWRAAVLDGHRHKFGGTLEIT